ncbi:MAG: hypothetical protein RMJ44_12150 [Cytophagales bacterium]|nr:hypothetical protein [Candidatus Dojkabacteria bacterium]MDW8211825.1 hypothetical protein [Cytophagales bacterium]
MLWKKLGHIFKVNNDNEFLKTHAANPLPIQLDEKIFRVFYSGRDKNNRSSVGYVDLNLDTLKIVNYPKEPVFTYGNENSFYSHGVSIGNMYQDLDGKCFILFMGWQIRENQHWRGDIGRLMLINKEKLILNPTNPFLKLDNEDPISLSYPFVLFHNNEFKMWYGSTITWNAENGEMIHVIKYVTSYDGTTWKKHGIAIPYEIGKAQAFSRPCVVIDSNGFHMWYSFRKGDGTKYRIGYSHSLDGVNWIRKDELVGIDVSKNLEDWDSEMLCYPFVFDHNGKRYMLYNGNSFGKEGFGLAILEQD